MMRVMVTQLRLGDCEDPEIYLAEPAHKFLSETEQGLWLTAQQLTCTYSIGYDSSYLGYLVTLYADMTDAQRTEWVLRWG